MNSSRCAASAGASASAFLKTLRDTLNGTLAIAEMEVRKLRHDPGELLARTVQPVLWLVIFGQAFGQVRAFQMEGVSYQAFLTPGIISQSVMFVAIFFGISIIWEKDMGILQKFLAMP
ncbi:MAG: ABC transporter permease, partial [Moorella sp. (in: Bacteria)]|nr:ABC transporter permease [Moorella sp. (in: firmicutes)]